MIFRASVAASCFLLASQSVFAAAAPPAASTAPKTSTAPTAAPTAPAPSGDCLGSHERDACIVGTWQMTVNGAEEWMRAHIKNARVKTTSTSGATVTYSADGTFSTGTAHTQGTADTGKMHAETDMTAQASGHWSTASGKLNACTTSLKQQGTTTIMIGGKKTAIPTGMSGPTTTSQTYTCAGDVMTLTTHMSRGDMTSSFKRVH